MRYGFLKSRSTTDFLTFLTYSIMCKLESYGEAHFTILKISNRFTRSKGYSHIRCLWESIKYGFRFMELHQFPKGPHVHEHPAWPASIGLWQLSTKNFRLIRPPIITISIVMVNWGWKQGIFIWTWVRFELMYFRSLSIKRPSIESGMMEYYPKFQITVSHYYHRL